MTNWPFNYHAHTRYGDGHNSAADHAAAAVDRGMRSIGVSEHAPLGADIDWTMAKGDVPRYREELRALKAEYQGRVEIYAGLECDWWPEREEWWLRTAAETWDYRIGSVHFVTSSHGTWEVDTSPPVFEQGVKDAFGGDMRAACDAFFACERAAAASGRFDILGHFDLVKKFNKNSRYFDTGAAWYREMASSVIEAAASSGVIVEVNTAGLDKAVGEYYPAPWLIEQCIRRGVRITLSSDAHHSQEIQRHFPEVLEDLSRLGARELWRLEAGSWAPVRLTLLA